MSIMATVAGVQCVCVIGKKGKARSWPMESIVQSVLETSAALADAAIQADQAKTQCHAMTSGQSLETHANNPRGHEPTR